MFAFWPGYSGIVRYGRGRFLVIALFFALLLNAFLIVNFYWTDAVSISQRNILLGVLSFSWIGLLSLAAGLQKSFDSKLTPKEKDEIYRKAIVFYLRGLWHETESLIAPLLNRNPKEVEFLLLQATLYRHTHRYDEAIAVLDRLQLYEGSERWLLEIENERFLIGEEIARLQAPPEEVD